MRDLTAWRGAPCQSDPSCSACSGTPPTSTVAPLSHRRTSCSTTVTSRRSGRSGYCWCCCMRPLTDPGGAGLTRLTGWGRTAPSVAQVRSPRSVDEVVDALLAAGSRGVLPRGLGRSYGDAAQNAGGGVLDMTGLDRIHRVDTDSAEVDVDAGVSLDGLLRVLLPLGLTAPVQPGTRQVTVGGAIASDVHGKNHHVDGSFGNHLASMRLQLADGSIADIAPDRDGELFWATLGGMGLTGIVRDATLRLLPIETSRMSVDTDRLADLDA